MTGRYTDQHPQFTVFTSTGGFAPNAGGSVEYFTVGNTGDANRKDTFSDIDLTIVNANPLALDGNGRTVTAVFLNGSYNTVIKNSEGVQQDQVDNVTGSSTSDGIGSQVITNISTLAAIDTDLFKEVYVLGTATAGDGGQGHFYFNSTSVETADNINVVEPTVGGGRWLLQNNDFNSIYTQLAAGTADAITITPLPAVSDLDNTRIFFVQTILTNTITSPTFKVGTSAALPMVRDLGGANAVIAGDTGPIGNTMILKLRDDNAAYILMNPYMVITENLDADVVTTVKILDDNVTYPKIQDITATARILGRFTAGAGIIEEGTAAQVKTLLDIGTSLGTTLAANNVDITIALTNSVSLRVKAATGSGSASVAVSFAGTAFGATPVVLISDSSTGGFNGTYASTSPTTTGFSANRSAGGVIAFSYIAIGLA